MEYLILSGGLFPPFYAPPERDSKLKANSHCHLPNLFAVAWFHHLRQHYARPQCVTHACCIVISPCIAFRMTALSTPPLVRASASMSRVSPQDNDRNSPLDKRSRIAIRCNLSELSCGVHTSDADMASDTLRASTTTSIGGYN